MFIMNKDERHGVSWNNSIGGKTYRGEEKHANPSNTGVKNKHSRRLRGQSLSIASLMCLLLQPHFPTCVSAFAVVEHRNSCDVRRIIFGTAALSKVEKPLELLDQAYEKGFRRFDLARTYGAGESERIFGEWIKTRGICRESLDIITKGGMGEDKYGSPSRPLLTKKGLQEEVKSSLEALNIDVIDLYMFHRDDPRIPASTFVEWANEIVEQGQAKTWGVSNWSFDRFREAYLYATENGLVAPSGNSPQFSLAVPECEVWPTTHSISGTEHVKQIEWYEENNIELLCWEVLAKGFMAKEDLWPQEEVDPSTFHTPVEEGSNQWRIQRIQRAYCNDENYRRRKVALDLAQNCGLKLSQVAAMYPLSMGKHISVIFGSSNSKHLNDMIHLEHLYLDDEALQTLVGVKPKRTRQISFVPATSPPDSLGSVPLTGANNVKKFTRSKNNKLPFAITGIGIERSV